VEHSVQTKTDIEQLPGRVDGILHIANKTVSQHLAEAIKAVYAARVPDINYYLPAVENRWSMAAYGASHREAFRMLASWPHIAWSKARRPSDRVGQMFSNSILILVSPKNEAYRFPRQC